MAVYRHLADRVCDGTLVPLVTFARPIEGTFPKEREELRKLIGDADRWILEAQARITMNAFWEIVASNALLVVVLAVVVAVVGRFWKNPLGLYVLWLLVLLKFVTPPLLTVGLALPGKSIAVKSDHAAPSPQEAATTSSHQETTAVLDRRSRLLDETEIALPDPTVEAAPHAEVQKEIPWLMVLAGLWCLGTVGIVVWQALRIFRFQRLLRAAEPVSAGVLLMAAEAGKQLGLRRIPEIRMLPVRVSPMVWTLGLRPQLLLPLELFERLEPAAQNALLMHELAHVRRKDHLVRLLQLLVSTLFWWHPVVWWACRELQQLEEFCCDAMVVGMVPSSRNAYATALLDTLDFLCDGSIAAPLGATATKSSVLLARRIAMMKNRTGALRLTLSRLLLLVLAAAVPMSLAFGAKQPQSDEPKSANPAAVKSDTVAQPEVGSMQTTPTPKEKAKPPKELSFDLGNRIKLEMVLIPAGEFMMGLPDSDNDEGGNEEPLHRVRITKPFYLGKYLVTQEQWEAVGGKGRLMGMMPEMVGTGANPSHVKGPHNPVECVSWDGCQEFLDKLNAKIDLQGRKFILPTEAQWEYACRAGSTTRYYFGNDESKFGEYAWYVANAGLTSHPVGGKKPNAWGLYDMYGNVWEWCQDWSGGYTNSAVDDPKGPTTGSERVIRGGSWNDPANLNRLSFGQTSIVNIIGFRVSLIPAEAITTTHSPSANDQSGKAAAKPAAEVSFTRDQSATKEGVKTDSTPSSGHGLTAQSNADEAKATRSVSR